MYRTLTVCSFAALDALPEHALNMLSAAGDECFFDGLPWFQSLSRHALDAGDQVRIYCVEDVPRSEGFQLILPMLVRNTPRRLWKPRKLCSLSNYYSSLFGPVSNGNIVPKTAEELMRTIASESPRWDQIELRPLDHDSRSFRLLVESLQAAGYVVQTYFCFGNWYLKVQDRNYEQYFLGLPAILKNTVNRKQKKLAKSGRAKLEIVTGGNLLDYAIEAFESVYRASWKTPEPYPEFVPGLIRMCAKTGALRLGLIHVDGQPAAAQLWIVQNRSALIYKLAYDERFEELSVGTILTAALMKHVIDVDKVAEVDYLTGDDAYKKNWMSHRRERWGILAMNPRTPLGALAILRHVGGRAIKRALTSMSRAGIGSLMPERKSTAG